MQRRESAQRVPRFCRGSAGELPTASFVRSWRGDSSHDLASSSGTFDTSCSQLARWVPAPFDKRPGSPKGMGLRERWLLGAISPRQSLGQSPRGPCRSDSRARVLLGTDSQHAVVTCRCKPAAGTPPLDRRPALAAIFGLKDFVNLCRLMGPAGTAKLNEFDKQHQANSPLRSSPSRRLLCLPLHLAQQHASGCRTSSSRDRSTLSSCSYPDSSSVTKALVWQVVPIALLRRSLTCALWSRQGCRRKARRGNMAVCRATREHVFHVVP